MPTRGVNLDTNKYVQVNTKFNPLVLQAHRDSVRIVVNELKPAKSNKIFHLLGGKDAPLHFNSIDTNVWALALTPESSLVVTEIGDVPVKVSNVVDVSETDLTFETDIVTQLCEISRKISVLLEYQAILHKVNLEEG